jgi:hypothetical protein
MQHTRLADPDRHAAQSPLGDSLFLIAERQAKAAENPLTDELAQRLSVPWEERFSRNRDKITRRLEMIEAELNRMNEDSPPLSVFAGEQ